MYKILIVEDDKVIAAKLEEHLKAWDYDAVCVRDLRRVTEEFAAFSPQAVLMDIGLPFYNGYYWCKKIREISTVPVIFLSSASDNMNIVMAMNMGGDDFIAKPFDLEVLTAKLQAVLRRTYSSERAGTFLEHGGLILDMESAILVNGDSRIELTKNDYRIMELLMKNAGSVVSREKIMERLWESDEFIDDNTLTVNMTRLRKKLEAAGLENIIKTKKGMGYIIE
jgi:DNA-binding response OmpR family regulator